MLRHILTIISLLALGWRSSLAASTGNTTCLSSELDWYTNVVGETPCETYQRLRRICNSDYTVPKFNPNTPGDTCDDQVAGCCCNSIAWGLSMLCMNCQYDAEGDSIGIDAGVGAYQLYIDHDHCTNPVNQTLPAEVQAAVCNEGIKIDQNLYSEFWSTGDWYYVHTREVMTEDFAATNNNTFTHCNSTLQNTTSSATPSPTSSSTSSTALPTNAVQQTSGTKAEHSTHLGPILGGVIGGVIVALILAFIGFYLIRRQCRHRGPRPLDLSKEYRQRFSSGSQLQPMSAVTPFTLSGHNHSGSGGFANLPYSLRSPLAKHPHHASPTSPLRPTTAEHEADHHEDGGPLPALQRSASGRLPPVYRRSWDVTDPPTTELPGYESSPGERQPVPPGIPDDVDVERRGQLLGGETKARRSS
ncbi:hypothetical protein PYCCODRAFT_405342 [Trametes coccinea BRFM310]|uniref:Mid2 domain-containing protein n=1 Tax=Trametes coccinea (strain BRFM310) TaxID=1353009 RepID=A0A1Y2IMX3_TRAC3|nr:hypothetical protein PYCCODRAFT_405342 [Trametes coccinea BRFM310]